MTDSPRDMTELMSGYMDGQLLAEEYALAEATLRSDAAAAKVLAELQTLRSGIRALGDHGSELTGLPSLADQVLAQLDGSQLTNPEPADPESVTPASVEPARDTRRNGIGSRWRVYLSVAVLVIAAAAIGQVVLTSLDNQGNVVVDLEDDPGSESVGNEGNAADGEGGQQGNETPQLVDGNSSGDPGSPGILVAPGSEKVNPEMPEKPGPNGLANVTEDPTENVVGVQPDFSVLTGGKFLFVIEIGVTPEGVKEDVVRDVLLNNGIVYDSGLDVMPELEEQLLKSRFLNGVVQNDEEPVGGTVDLIYMVASGFQIDQTRHDIHSRHSEIARYRFNMALLPKDVGVFDHLHRTVKSQWATDDPLPKVNDKKKAYQQQLQQWKGKAGQLMTTLFFLAGKGTAVSKVGIDIPTTPATAKPVGANRGELTRPGPTEKPIFGADLLCEVLLVVRNMTEAEVERLQDVENAREKKAE